MASEWTQSIVYSLLSEVKTVSLREDDDSQQKEVGYMTKMLYIGKGWDGKGHSEGNGILIFAVTVGEGFGCLNN